MPTVIRVESEEVLGVKSRMSIDKDLLAVANSHWDAETSKDALTVNVRITHVLIILIELYFFWKLALSFVRHCKK